MSRTLLPNRPEGPVSSAAGGAEVLFKEARQRRRRRRTLMVAAVVVAIAATTAGVALSGSGPRSAAPAPVASPAAVLPLGPPPNVAWVDYQGRVHVGSLQTHQQRVVATGSGSPTAAMVASASTLFWVDGGGVVYDKKTRKVRTLARGVMAYDTATGRERQFASGSQVFNAVDNTDVLVASDDGRRLARYGLDGRLVEQFTLPNGWYLPDPFSLGTSSPALAHGQILVYSPGLGQAGTKGSPPLRLGVWEPATGRVRVFGDSWFMVATYTDSHGADSLIAWLPATTCVTSNENCALQLTDLASGVTQQIRNPLGFGFDMRGAFSPDGRQLAAFAKTNSGGYNPETRLALIDVATGGLRSVPGATIGIGEAVAWAQWLPASTKVVVGGTSGEDGSGKWGANHFLVESTTLRAVPFSFVHDGQQDVNYSAVLLP
jgi:hypothetical protein